MRLTKDVFIPYEAYLNDAAGLLKSFSQRNIVKEDGKLLNIHNSGKPQILHTLSACSESTDLN
jgi:hypothetical protein